MKKDRKWFIDKWTKERNKTHVHDPMYHFINEFIADVSQLDEPEVLSQEWIEGNTSPVDDEGRLYIWKRDLENLIIPKQELPVIPIYVAKYLEFAKSDVSLKRVMELANTRYELPRWEKEYDWISENSETFARAWLDGYEVEEEPLYYALIKGHELIDSGFKYWTCHTRNQRGAFVGRKILYSSKYKTVLPISVWDDFGLNDSNADFIKVEE